MKSPSQILLLFALLSLRAITFSQKEAETQNPDADVFNACGPNNRPEVCTLEFAPVCGYIHNCEGGACTSTFSNDCAACADPTVDGYVNGTCEDVKTTCDPNDRPEICIIYWTPTCAVEGDCQGPHCFENVADGCMACRMQGVVYWLPGSCPEYDQRLRESCNSELKPKICPEDWNPVCAHHVNCVGNYCWRTAGNACSVCMDENIDFYIPGECLEIGIINEEGNVENGENEENYIEYEEITVEFLGLCDVGVAKKPEICVKDNDPVCAHMMDCDGNEAACFRTRGNDCEACNQGDVDYFYRADCRRITWD